MTSSDSFPPMLSLTLDKVNLSEAAGKRCSFTAPGSPELGLLTGPCWLSLVSSYLLKMLLCITSRCSQDRLRIHCNPEQSRSDHGCGWKEASLRGHHFFWGGSLKIFCLKKCYIGRCNTEFAPAWVSPGCPGFLPGSRDMRIALRYPGNLLRTPASLSLA